MIELNEFDLIRIMEEHHRWKWNNNKEFVIEKKADVKHFGNYPKPKYLYKKENDVFYLSEELIKIILCEYFCNYDIEKIDFITSVYPINTTQEFVVRRNERGEPADQESMRYMRHPYLYNIPKFMPVFGKVVIYIKEKNNDNQNGYCLSRSL